MILSILLQLGSSFDLSSLSSFIFPIAIIAVFYFFILRPQNQKTKKQAEFTELLEKGKKVVTNGGIHGKIVKVSEGTVTVEIAANTQVKMEKSAVSLELTEAHYEA